MCLGESNTPYSLMERVYVEICAHCYDKLQIITALGTFSEFDSNTKNYFDVCDPTCSRCGLKRERDGVMVTSYMAASFAKPDLVQAPRRRTWRLDKTYDLVTVFHFHGIIFILDLIPPLQYWNTDDYFRMANLPFDLPMEEEE